MPLVLCPASRSDAEKIASIHMTAFESNVMLHAQFPTPAAREGLQRSVKAKAIADIDDARTTVLVVRDLSEAEQRRQSKDGYLEQGVDERKEGGVEGQVIAFAKWSHPVPEDEEYSEPEWVWKEEANLKMIDKWTKRTEEAQENAVGRTPCYRLSFIGTDPIYQRRGAGSLLLQWGTERCREEHVQGYVESTMEAAAFYKRHGFSAIETFSVDLDKAAEGGSTNIYKEISFIFRPSG